jgi:hypothetical protein
MHNTRGQVISLLSSSSDDDEPDQPDQPVSANDLAALGGYPPRYIGRHNRVISAVDLPLSAQSSAPAESTPVKSAPGGESVVQQEVQLIAVVTRDEAQATAKRTATDLTATDLTAVPAARVSKKQAVKTSHAPPQPSLSPHTTVVVKQEMADELVQLRAHYQDVRITEVPEEFQCEGIVTREAPPLIEQYPRIQRALKKFHSKRKRPADADLTELLLLRRLRGWEAGGATRGEAAPSVDHILGAYL